MDLGRTWKGARLRLTKRSIDALPARERPYDVRDADLRGFLVRVEVGGSKTFFFDYRLNGKRNRYRLGCHPTLLLDEARIVAKTIAGDVARGIDPQARKKAELRRVNRDRASTLRACLNDRYEPWAAVHLKSAVPQLARLRSDFASWLDRPLHELSIPVVEGWRQKWRRDGLQPRTINRNMQRLQSVLSRAIEWGMLDSNPLSGLKPLKTDKNGRVRFLTPEEESGLRKALVEREERLRQARVRFNQWRIARGKSLLPNRDGDLIDHLRPMVLVALNTGLRRGELLSLRWADVNLQARFLTVVAASAKSGQSRTIPLNKEAASVLETWKDRQMNLEGLVFPGINGRRMDNINRSWGSVSEAAKLLDFRFHDLRHTFASKLVQSGVDLYTVKELLGHSEISMTERYAHLAPGNLRAAVEKLVG